MFKKILLTGGLFFALPIMANAALPGARSASNDNGDVFLGGNYIEVGISKSGSFGTSANAPAEFGSHSSYGLGLIADGDGWDNGNDPTTGDFFLPGTPEERWGIAYKINGVTYQYFFADRMDEQTNDSSLHNLWDDYQEFLEYTNQLKEWLDQHDEEDLDYEDKLDMYNEMSVYTESAYSSLKRKEILITIEDIDESITAVNEDLEYVRSWLEAHEDSQGSSDYSDYERYYANYEKELNYLTDLKTKKENGTIASSLPVVSVVDKSVVNKNLLKAYVSGITNENVKVELTYSFGVDDKYYNTEVIVTNHGNKPITDVRFIRSFDPDQDAQTQSAYDTYNKVICNPDSSKEGSDENFAMVVARGSESLDGFFFVSFDNRARVSRGVGFFATDIYKDGYWVNTTEGLPTKATDDNLSMSKDETNGYELEDNAIAITFKLDTINAGAESEFNYYSSLDPNVISSISKILKAVAADVKNLSDTRIEVETKPGYEYSIDGGNTWQDSGVFEGLEPGTEYTILSRLKAVGETPASEPEETVVTTKKSSRPTPDVMEVIVTENEITIETKPGYEYSRDGGKTWQTSPTFTGLEPDTEYTIIARYKETSTDMAGIVTEPIKVRTSKKIETALDNATNVDVAVEVGADSVGITIHKGLLYEAVMDDEEVKGIVDAGHDATIVFDVEDLALPEADLKDIKAKLDDDTIAFTVDAKLKLYEDGVYVKDISSTGKKITFTIKVPKEYVKPGRKFTIIRKHVNDDGFAEYEILEDEDDNDNTITVSSDRFSEFTVAYKDLANPKTGDNVLVYFFTLLISAGAILIVNKLTRKEV